MLRALLMDLYGTAFRPIRPVAETYARQGRAHGVEQDQDRLMTRFQQVFTEVSGQQRMEGDGRAFWQRVVAEATGCDDAAYFEDLFRYFGRASSYRLDPHLLGCCARLRAAGLRLGIVSNADSRTRAVLAGLGLDRAVHEVLISGELPWDKPQPEIFHLACERLGVEPAQAVHVGDSPHFDLEGARGAGLLALHYGVQVRDFSAVERWVLQCVG